LKQDDKRKDQDLDIHVIPVWNQGITGKGVVVTILDDGKYICWAVGRLGADGVWLPFFKALQHISF
jgi:hypothetical protein